MKVESLFLYFLAALGLGAFFTSFTFSPAGRRFPLLVSLILLVLVFLQGVTAARRATPGEPRLSREDFRQFLSGHAPVILWSIAGFVIIYLFGFSAGSFLLVLGYMLHQRENWPAALAYAAGTAILTYFGFQIALQVRFYPGLILELLGF